MKTIGNLAGLAVVLGALGACSTPEKTAGKVNIKPNTRVEGPRRAEQPASRSAGATNAAPATAAQLAAAAKVVPLVSSEMMEFSKNNIAVLVYTDPSMPAGGSIAGAVKDLQAKNIIPAGARVDVRAGNVESMKTYFGQAIGWPVVIVRGPKGQSISSGEQAVSMVGAGVKKVK